MSDKAWKVPQVKAPKYGKAQLKAIERYEADLKRQLKRKPARYEHSLSVAATAEAMAVVYGVDPFSARVAGILHDWSKALDDDEQIKRAKRYGIDLHADPKLVSNLYHGYIAAAELPKRYPELPKDVLRAISRHTTAAKKMGDLDMVLFVADGIEPRRKPVPAIQRVRAMVDARDPLRNVFLQNFSSGIAYVVSSGRYLWPGTVEIYNSLVTA